MKLTNKNFGVFDVIMQNRLIFNVSSFKNEMSKHYICLIHKATSHTQKIGLQ